LPRIGVPIDELYLCTHVLTETDEGYIVYWVKDELEITHLNPGLAKEAREIAKATIHLLAALLRRFLLQPCRIVGEALLRPHNRSSFIL
jgi:hypothetical protein